MALDSYFIGGVLIGISIIFFLTVLIFLNTIRMYVQKNESGNRFDDNVTLINRNEGRIEQNLNLLEGINSKIDEINNEVDDQETKIDMVDTILKNNSFQQLNDRFVQMESDWEKQFDNLIDVQEENVDIFDNMINNDKYMFVDISEENSENLNRLENNIDKAEIHIQKLRDSMTNIQYPT
jgi:methyl-accepting chemotaxis protein